MRTQEMRTQEMRARGRSRPPAGGCGGLRRCGSRPGWAVFLSPGFLTATYLPDMWGWKSGDIKIKLQTCIKTEPFAGSRND